MTKAFGPKRSKSFSDNYRALALIVAAFFFFFSANAQYDSTKSIQQNNAYGYDYNILTIRTMLNPPSDTFHLAQAHKGSIAVVNNVLYTWSGIYWLPIQGTGGGTSGVTVDYLDSVLATLPYGGVSFNPGMLGTGTFADPAYPDTITYVGSKYKEGLLDTRIDSLVANWPTGGGSAFGDTVVHNNTLTGQGITGNPLKADTTKITATVNARLDSLINAGGVIPNGSETKVLPGSNIAVAGNGTTVTPYIISAAITGGNPRDALSILDYGGIRNSTATASRNANLAAWTAMLTAATDGQECDIPSGEWYFPASSLVINSTTKKANINVIGNVHFLAGASSGFIMEGTYHFFTSTGFMEGGNTGATDSTSYAAYTGTGINLRNCDKCYVNVNRIENFKYGIKYGGESTTIPKGTQYCRVYFNQIRQNYAQIYVTTTSTTDGTLGAADNGNWSTSGTFFGGQLGRGTSQAGGTFGVLVQKEASSNQGGSTGGNPFNYFHFINIGYEGLLHGVKAQNMDYSSFSRGRNEQPAIDGYLFNFRQDVTNGLDCKDIDLSDFPLIYENQFAPGGWGNQTRIGRLVDSTGTTTADLVMKNGQTNGYINLVGDEPGTRRSIKDMIAVGGMGGNLNERYALHVIRATGPVDDYVSFDGKSTTVTGTTYTVANNISTVWGNPSTVLTVTLPAPASWTKRRIAVKNKHAVNTVTVAGTIATGNTTSLDPFCGAIYESDGTSWYDITQKPPGGGGGSSQWTNQSNGISYGSRISVGQATNPGAMVDIGSGGGTIPGLRLASAALLSTPLNNSFENFADRIYITHSSIRKEILTAPSAGGLPGQVLEWPASGTQLKYADPNFVQIFNQNSTTTIANTTSATSIYGGASTLPRALTTTDDLVQTGGGIINAVGTTPNINFIIRYNGVTQYTYVIPPFVGGRQYLYTYTINASVRTTGSSAPVYTDGYLLIYDNTTGTQFLNLPIVGNGGGAMNTTAPTCDIQMQWSAANVNNIISSTKNKIIIQSQQ